jgi:O-antigen/teichoic acid export membrane protein
VTGVRWVAIAQFVGELISLGASVVLAHLVTPAEFGHAAVALVLTVLGVTLSYQGFGSVLVQREHLDQAEAETSELLSMAFGLLAAGAIWVTAPLWAEPLFGSATSHLMRLASPTFAIASVGVVSRARLQRQLDFRRMSRIEVSAFSIGSVASVVAAAIGFTAEALIVGALVGTIMETGLMCLAEPPPRPRLDPGCIREIAAFGLASSLASLAWTARRNIDYVVLAARLPAAQVGFYWRAFSLGGEYQEKVSGIIARLAFPLFSRTQDVDDTRLLRSRVVRANVAVIFPLLATLIIVAPTLIPWLYGARWEPAVVPAQILAVAGMALTVMSGTEQLILAMGRPRMLLVLNASFLFATALAVLAASPYGLTAVCLSVAGVHVVMVAVAQAGILRRLVDIKPGQLAADLVPATTASAAMLAVGALVGPSLGGVESPLIKIAMLASIGIATYLLAFRVLFASAWAEMTRTIRRVVLPKPRNTVIPPPVQESVA